MGKLSIMDGTGHTEVLWNPASATEVAAARSRFDELVEKENFTAWAMRAYMGGGAVDAPIKTFDPAEEEILMMRPMMGG